MDFRSQLSAFQNKSGRGGGGGGDRGGDRDRDRGRDRDNSDRGGDRDRGGGGDRDRGGGGDRDRGRGYASPNNSRSPNTSRYSNNNNRGNNTGGSYYGRGSGGSDHQRDQLQGGDRRRQRPGNWDHSQGPPNQRRRHNSPDRDGLGSLRTFGYRIPRGFPPPATPEAKAKKAKHIALMVITIDDLPYEHIWKAWCQTLNPGNAKDDYFISVVCHAKYPAKVQSGWLKQRMLVYPPKVGRGNSYLDPDFLSRAPNWGSVEITRAMLDLLQSGLKIGHCKQKDMRFSANRFLARRPLVPLDSEEEIDDSIPPVDQFLYVSETCLPVVSAQEMFELASDTTVSWVNARHRRDPDTPKNAYENDQFGNINRRIPGQYRWKADQWVLLCRHHAQQIMNMDRPHIPPKHQLWQSFREINASDEMYIPTCLAMLGWLRFASDGEDTQKSRSGTHDGRRGRSDSNSTDERGGRSNSNDDRRGGDRTPHKDEKTPTDAASNDSKPVQRVLKRPVTYTDWSEGMRNPATFINGMSDFKRVSRLARKKGCLVARKFAPFAAVPGVSAADQKVTGEITVEEWKEEIGLLSDEFKVDVAAAEPEVQHGGEAANDEPSKDANKGDDHSSSGEEEEQEES
eukprot:CAMPEP_0117053282 /NCGR_PEP_ID=MMETSP0472-20121206/36841_1 /TAXON_ID=693140 ORGANISM="Tiarina fusus, Strain LIS" /NCGR_SAMPLE_ID=MMETSP0472 /ASSEMBLY_ACC=CAM_ASM_000603 /LENGTH=624 /DNA_ID=CAMNT_0004768253 /DNA_START=206 /DNA_END=2076 /DNA_ORIENTATION=+